MKGILKKDIVVYKKHINLKTIDDDGGDIEFKRCKMRLHYN